MKILWFTNTPSLYMPESKNYVTRYNGGGWIASAEKEIRKIDGIELAVAFFYDGQPFKICQGSSLYYPIPTPCNTLRKKIADRIRLLTHNVEKYEKSIWEYYFSKFKSIIDDFKPDIIHVWGSEAQFGLVWKITDIPMILHLQGIINPYFNAYLPANISWKEYGNTNMILRKIEKRKWLCSSYREKEIMKGVSAVLGRTEWDRRVSHCMNPEVRYFHVDEILRDAFYMARERILPKKTTIITTISSAPYKGYDMVLKTAEILKNNLKIDFVWKCYGDIEPRWVETFVGIKHEDVNVELCGVVDSLQLQEAEANATLYCHPSYIDNSPNSLCEAQMMSLPVVATFVGGIPSLIDNGIDGFLAPANDPYQAAYHIERLANDKELNIAMGEKARGKAMKRHDKKEISKQLLAVYCSVLGETNGKK